MHKLMITILLGSLMGRVLACDVCGCSMGGLTPEIVSFQTKHFVGLNYATRSFTSEHPILFEGEAPSSSAERFNTMQIMGRASLHRFVQISGSLPVHHFVQEEGSSVAVTNGIGDAQLLLHGVFATTNADSSNYGTRLTVGGGVKAPTGSHQALNDEGSTIIPAMQMGSGSWDVVARSTFLQRIHRWGFNAQAFYRWNNENKSGYRFGNRFSGIAKALRWISVAKMPGLIIAPETGISYQSAEKDYTNVFKDDINEYSGGYFLDGLIGLNLFYNNFNLGVTFLAPIRQYYAQGLVYGNKSFNLQLNYIFKSK